MAREQLYDLTPFLRAGLSRDPHRSLNVPGLQTCLGLRPRESLEQLPTLTDFPSSGGVWPYPQLFKGDEFSLLAYSNAIKTADLEAGTETARQLYSLSGTTVTPTTLSLSSSYRNEWQFANNGNFFALTSGNEVILSRFVNDKVLGYASYDLTFGYNVSACCYHKGRVLFGGFLEDLDWDTHWNSLADDASAKFPRTPEGGSNQVWWSSIGGGDAIFPFMSDSTSIEAYKAFLLRNEMGFLKMKWQGDVLAMRELGDFVIVYGTQGITALRAVSQPVSTLVPIELAKFGLLDAGAVAAGPNKHFFVSATGKVYTLDRELALNHLGYDDLFSDALDAANGPVMGSYDPELDEYYLGYNVDQASYIFTEAGAGQSSVVTSSLARDAEGNLLGTVNSGEADTEFTVLTNPFDCGSRGIKVLEFAFFTCEALTDIQFRVHARNSNSDSFVPGSWRYAASEGRCPVGHAGVEFMLEIKGTLSTTSQRSVLNGLAVSWYRIDDRGVRGPYPG